MNIIWSPLAIEKAAQIAHYIAEDDRSAAENWINSLFEKVDSLLSFPKIGRSVPEVGRKNIREIIFKNYRIIYKLESHQISILTIRHCKQLLSDEIE